MTECQRYQIQALDSNGFSQRKIAAQVKVHHSTVSRELKRNRAAGKDYCGAVANALSKQRRQAARKHTKRHERHDPIIADGLLMGWSPEKISLGMKLEVPELSLSHTTTYQRIAVDKANGVQLHQRLVRYGKSRYSGGKRNSGRSLIPNRIDISHRPQKVAERSRIGDWEGDTVHGKNGYLVTLAERRSRLVLIGKAADKKAETVAEDMIQLLQRVQQVHTITLDNGGEFALHTQVAKASGATIYFAKPYASYQRGTNENTNGLIRRYWPKGTDFETLPRPISDQWEARKSMTTTRLFRAHFANLS